EGDAPKTADNISQFRRIGKEGFILVFDEAGNIVSGPESYDNTNIYERGLSKDFLKDKEALELFALNFETKDLYSMFQKSNGFWILAMIPQKQVLKIPALAVYVSIFMDTISFFVMFLMVFIIVKSQIVKNIDKIADSLKKITAGNLGEKVNARESAEFASLSDGINQTVASLKENLNKVAAQAEKELSFARMIQNSAMPSVFPAYPGRDEFDIYAKMIPAKEVGGDFYDFYFAGDEKLAILVADVSGKGVPSAMFMMQAKTLLKSLIESGLSPAEVFEKANDSLSNGNDAGMFLSAWLGIVDLKKGSIAYANAGHKAPILLKEYDGIKELESDKNFVLGGIEGIVYKESQRALEDNDTIFLFTDGITESKNEEGKSFGQQRLLEILQETQKAGCKEKCENIILAAEKFRGNALQEDDIALLCFKFNYRVMTGEVEYNDVVEQAVEFALKAHRDEKRKSNGVPYILHPIEVSAISSRLTMEREVMAAALLHDTVEDAGVTKEQLLKKFGERVTELVMAETEDKHREMSAAASWKMRKEESIRDLRATSDKGVKAMWLSDKLSNLRSLYADWREKGSGVWQVFNQKDPAQHAWLYMSIIECMGDFKETPEYKEYIKICQEVFGNDWTFKAE
nr:SpoIIE family protein phosphatase [Treponema sp.]